MTDFLLQYGLFLAKALTWVIAIIVTLSAIISMALRARGEDGILVISCVNDKMNELRQSLQAETLPKKEFKKWLKSEKQKEKQDKKSSKSNDNGIEPRLFILRFDGDIKASQIEELRETISAILEIALPKDEVLVVLESAGGFVHSYGLAASQLQRIRQKNLNLTVAIDKCAASGGYMMAVTANNIIAAPFAIVGSIGVIAQLPNFHRLLEQHNIDFELHTAGEYKRTLTIFGENTDKAREKFQEELEETHQLFKDHIHRFRPQLQMEKVATGEHWHAITALDYELIDAIQTSDDFIMQKINTHQAYEVSYEYKQTLAEKLTSGISTSFEKALSRMLSKLRANTLMS
jgi:serine protease SohB